MQQIADWLEKLGLGQYAQRFAENDISFGILPHLTDQDLKELGVASLGHRRQLLSAIADLSGAQKGTPQPTSATEAAITPRDTAERRRVADRAVRVLVCRHRASEKDLPRMEFRFDPHHRRLRIRTMAPPGQQASTFVADGLFQFGIEEEYFLSDARTLQAASRTPDALFQSADFGIAGHIGREFLQE